MTFRKKIIVLGIFHFPYGTAPASRIKNIAYGFKQNGKDVDVLALYPPPNTRSDNKDWVELETGIRYKYLRKEQAANKSIQQKIRWFSDNLKIGREILNQFNNGKLEQEYSAIFVYGRNLSILGPITKYAKTKSVPIILDIVELPRISISFKHILNPIHLDHYLGMKKIAQRSTVISVITRYLSEYISNKEAHYLLPSVQDWSKASLKNDKLTQLSNPLQILYIGSLIDRDNPSVLLDFIKSIGKKSNVEFVLLGRFKNKPGFQALKAAAAKDQNLKKVIRFVGEVTEEEKDAYYENAAAFIMPRRNHIDEIASFPTRLVECLIEGKPVIASPVGDIPFYLNKEEIVYLDENNVEKSAKETIRMLQDDKLYQSRKISGFKKARKVFNTKTHIFNILEKINLG